MINLFLGIIGTSFVLGGFMVVVVMIIEDLKKLFKK
jgi:hypothetical protein